MHNASSTSRPVPATSPHPGGSSGSLKLDNCEIPDHQIPYLGISLRDFQWINYWEKGGFKRIIESIDNSILTK
jgi:hypothetical protein